MQLHGGAIKTVVLRKDMEVLCAYSEAASEKVAERGFDPRTFGL